MTRVDVLEAECLDEPFDVAVVIGEHVLDVRLMGLAETDVVRRDASSVHLALRPTVLLAFPVCGD